MALSFPFLSRPLSTLLWLGAFLSSLYFVNEWQLGFFACSIILLFAWAWVSLGNISRGEWRIPKSPALGFAAAFWALTFLSVFWSELPLVSLSAFCFFSALPLTFFVFTLSPDEKQFRQIIYAGIALFTGLGVWAIIQYYTGYNVYSGQAHHPLADPSSLGGFFNLALIPAVAALLLVKKRPVTIALLLFIAVMAGGLLATGSRGALFAMVLALIPLFAGAWSFTRHAHARVGMLALLFVALATLSQFTPHFVANKPVERMADTLTLAQDDVSNNRLNIWDGAAGIIKHHWLHGTGMGTFFLYYPEYRSPAEHIGASHAHSDPIQFWAELGIFGPVLFYGFLIAALVRTWRALSRLSADDPRRLHILMPLCALGAVVIQSHVSFNFYNLCILFGCGFMLALWFDATRRILNDDTFPVSFPPDMKMPARRFYLALPFIPVLFLFISYMGSEHYVNSARDALLRDGNLPQFAVDLRRAHDLDHGLNFRTWLLAANIPLGILQETANTLTDDKKKEFYEQASGQLARAHTLNPRSSSVLFYQAKLQTLVPPALLPSDAPKPEDLYKEALRLDPTHLGARMALSKIQEDGGNEDAAIETLRAGFDYNYTTPLAMDYYGRAMILFLARGDKEMYQQAMNKMVFFKRRMQISYIDQAKKRGPLPVGQEEGLN